MFNVGDEPSETLGMLETPSPEGSASTGVTRTNDGLSLLSLNAAPSDAHRAYTDPAIPMRWVIGVLGFLMEVVCYADRTNISLGILKMSEQYGYDGRPLPHCLTC
jgi:hypothetical protein